MLWTELSGMVYVVPFIIGAFAALLAGTFLSLSSVGNIQCPVCKKSFGDVFGLRKHTKEERASKAA
ncbi:MAG: hypothetical protein V3W31_09410 [Thermodesulfobacteriota bacterium]